MGLPKATASSRNDKRGSMASSNSLPGTYVWVRTDLVEAIVDNGGEVPAGWKPRKRVRSSLTYQFDQPNADENDSGSWGWCRARVSSSVASQAIASQHATTATSNSTSKPTQQQSVLDSNDGGNPFAHVKLRKTNRTFPEGPSLNDMPTFDRKPRMSWIGSPDRAKKSVFVTITVDDHELAPAHIQNRTVSFTYETSDYNMVCAENSWAQKQNFHRINDCSADESMLQPPDDLTSLEHLHEPAIVSCLQKRYDLDQIYTYTGKILLALNPFRSIDNIYSEQTMKLYWKFKSGIESDITGPAETQVTSAAKRPPPHVYAIAADAYRSMMQSFSKSTSKLGSKSRPHKLEVENQSVLVSGESGSGKTVTTKIILRYLATISAEKHKSKDRREVNATTIESQVLGWNPILESFGNARTVRNDNSSRFGKFLEMQFESTGCLVSASLETYLLEKVRLISQAPGERNYHIFYEILAGLPRSDRQLFRISNKNAVDFRMTASSGTYDRRDGVDDRETFNQLRNALDTVGFTKSDQKDLFHVVCALLHTSNLTFVERSADGSVIDRSNPSLQAAVSLLGVNEQALNDALTKCAISVRNEIVYKNLPVDRAEKAVEAFIKTTYGAIFMFIVRKMNKTVIARAPQDVLLPRRPSFHGDNMANSSHQCPTKELASIGVLDIFGFESFDKNSFEQLCINYCNEALQQQFNRFVFKLEQQEYEREGIEWSFIEFPDNQDVLDLIEKKHDGILSILDEQCRLPRCTDATFAAAIYSKLADHPRMEVTKTQRARQTFAICHYAGLVEYNTELFLEKNKDELPKETTELLMSSSYPFLAKLGMELTETEGVSSTNQGSQHDRTRSTPHLNRAASSLIRDSVGIQFCAQLRSLRTRIESTAPHYVRCLKPNDCLVPHNFNHLTIADQLRCAGVLEAIRVSRIGFPHRYFHDQFVQRYGILAQNKVPKQRGFRAPKLSAEEACESLIQNLSPVVMGILNEGPFIGSKTGSGRSVGFLGMQMGKSKVFLRKRAFEALENIRFSKLEKSATIIESVVRMHRQKTWYKVQYNAIILIQRFARHVEDYIRERERRIQKAASVIQSMMRGLKYRKQLIAARWIAWWCQSAYRGAVARQYCAYLFLNRNAAVLQRAWRTYCGRRFFRKLRRCVVTIQNRYRSRLAFSELCRLRKEAKDLSTIAAERDKFKEESRRLREELEKAKQMSPVKSKNVDREGEIQKLRHEVQRLHFELEKAHRMHSPSKRSEQNAKRLIEELADKEDELERLKRELDGLRARDENSSIRSITVATSCPSEFSYRGPKPQSSPVRSDTSLLDNDEDGDDYYGRKFRLSGIDPPDIGQEDENLQILHKAIRLGDNKTFDQILHSTSEVCVLINQGDRYGRSAIHIASLALRPEIADALISKGAVVNAQDDDGETPLHLAENGKMTEVLLTKGKANPNIPNVDGICALHLAVQRRDVESVRLLVSKNANVNNADNVRWFTSIHLVALPSKMDEDIHFGGNARLQIAQILTNMNGPSKPDVNYQDSEGNTPLHYAVQLESKDCYELVSLLLERGANPNIRNVRDQIPLHLLCHNTELRSVCNYQDIIHIMLMHGADPNLQSLTGCTPLHLSLYHRDVDSAVQLVSSGAELHLVWKKPKRWPAFWKDMGSSRVVALDMVEDSKDLFRILSAITTHNMLAPNRPWCMHCKKVLSKSRSVHCRHCSRLTCLSCSRAFLGVEYFPEHFKVLEPSSVCTVCETILTAQKEVMTNITYPMSSYADDDEDRFSC